MCTVVVLRRPHHPWPLILAANRDELADRPWTSPGRHWPEQSGVVGGLDVLGGGTWVAMNDDGVIAAVLNRINTLGPLAGRRSRGELPLRVLRHACARAAADALGDLDPYGYRPFNLVICDAEEAFFVRATDGSEAGTRAGLRIEAIPVGLSMVTAYDRNDLRSPRIRRYLPCLQKAPAPQPDRRNWRAWTALLACRDTDADAGPGGAMTVITDTGFGTVCSSLMALPRRSESDGARDGQRTEGRHAVWLFAAGPPAHDAFVPVPLT
ncbi:MAG: NRDE family protein [Rhodospirillales bacterium]|nr:NRDE family protein [Rhodospirillales bacterium]